MAVLREYHAALGDEVSRFEGTLERFTGDGLMVFFNDPLPCPDAPGQAVRMAVAMRNRLDGLAENWRRRGHELQFAAGIAQGYATLGVIGFQERFDYAAIGAVTNLAQRLCAQALGRADLDQPARARSNRGDRYRGAGRGAHVAWLFATNAGLQRPRAERREDGHVSRREAARQHCGPAPAADPGPEAAA